MTEATKRSLTIEWDDPLATAARAPELSGIDFLRGIVSGEIPPPPIARLLNVDLVEVETGRAVFAGVPDKGPGAPGPGPLSAIRSRSAVWSRAILGWWSPRTRPVSSSGQTCSRTKT